MIGSVSVVIPNWNGSARLQKLLGDLEGQSQFIERVLVVDNGSADDSVAVAKRAGAEVIELGVNTGFSHAVNRGIERADAEWIAVLNNDVSLEPDWLTSSSTESRGHQRLVCDGQTTGCILNESD